jgi:5S rRNA maturation endonuclease (ribonuclease M5)
MIAEEFAARLQGARSTPSGWQAHCPAHDDRNASLSIATGGNGGTVIKCHAGCDTEKIVAAMGLHMADLFPPKAEGQSRKKRQIEKTYDYTDAAGKLLFQVVRYVPKDFRQRRLDPDRPGKWLWSIAGIDRVLYRLPDVLRTKSEGRVVFVVEGEKDAEALAGLGLCGTCNSGGAGKWTDTYTTTLTGAKVVILPDRDEPGRRHAAIVLQALTGKAESVRVVELPDREGRKVKDAADWIGAGGTVAELREIVKNAPPWTPPAESQPATPAGSAKAPAKPRVLLPNGGQSISDTGRALGELLAKTERFFVRGGVVVRLTYDHEGLPSLDPVKPATLASDFEAVASLCRPIDEGQFAPTTCSEQTAKLIAASAAFREVMPPINVLTLCPVLIERAGSLIQVSGYDRESGIFAAGAPTEPMDLAEARRLLSEILAGFRFATPADRSRALAAMVTPALVFGGLLKGRAPIDLGEANASQTGKGYRNKLTAALYGQSVKTVTQQRAGVGSMEESFNMALIRGANFIALDNVRGKIDSPSFESFLTEDTYLARAPYREPVEIDPRRVVIMLTSNKADVTTDLSNRCACVLLLKQREGHTFTPYPEGDILEHVRARQPRYLGAVFAVIRAWHDAGKQRTAETRHDFRPWAQVLDWITRNLLDAGPLLDGHRETQARMTNPALGWLRDVAIEVIRIKQAGAWLRACQLAEIMDEAGGEVPGLPEHGDLTDHATRDNVLRAIGRKLGTCFKSGDVLTVDGMTIDRREMYESASHYNAKEYRFSPAAIDSPAMAAHPSQASNLPPETAEAGPEFDRCGHGCGHSAAMDAAIKPQYAAIAAITPLQCEHSDHVTDDEGVNIITMGTYGRMAATSTRQLSTEEVIALLKEMAEAAASETPFEEGTL